MQHRLGLALSILSRALVFPVLAVLAFAPTPDTTPTHAPVPHTTTLELPKLDRSTFPGCLPPARHHGIPTASVVVTLAGDIVRVPFDQAWQAGHNTSRADDVWVIGVCS